jgi:hypothetical protein
MRRHGHLDLLAASVEQAISSSSSASSRTAAGSPRTRGKGRRSCIPRDSKDLAHAADVEPSDPASRGPSSALRTMLARDADVDQIERHPWRLRRGVEQVVGDGEDDGEDRRLGGELRHCVDAGECRPGRLRLELRLVDDKEPPRLAFSAEGQTGRPRGQDILGSPGRAGTAVCSGGKDEGVEAASSLQSSSGSQPARSDREDALTSRRSQAELAAASMISWALPSANSGFVGRCPQSTSSKMRSTSSR